MNGLDIIIIIIIAGAILRGFQLGLIRQLIHLLGFFIAIFLAYHFSNDLAPYIEEVIPAPSFSQSTLYRFSESFEISTLFYNALAFFLIFIGTKVLINIGGAILHQIASLPGLAIVNRFSGGLIGLVQAVLIIIIVLNVMTVMPYEGLHNTVEGSSLSSYFFNLTPIVTEKLYHLWNTSSLTTTI